MPNKEQLPRIKRSTVGFLSLLFFIAVPRVLAFNEHKPFDISADMIDYTDSDQTMTADGHVVVIQGTSTLKADHMRYDRAQKRLFAQGHVLLNDNGAVMLGETMDYDLVKQKGIVTGALGFQQPWLFSAKSWEKQLDYYLGRNVSLTSCDLVDPHYHIRSSRVHMVPNEHFWAWNNIAYADTAPVFYSPFIYRSLAKRRIVVQFSPGHDQTNGNFVKTVTTLRLTDHIYNKVLFDHYSEQGNGWGDEFNYKVPGKLQGSLFGYYIDPHGNNASTGIPDSPQYNFRAYHWQRLDPTLTLQSNVNLRNNVSFNNLYFPQDTNQQVTDINNSVAMTKQTRFLNQQLVVQSLNAPDSTDTSTYPAVHVQNANLPQYNVTMYQYPLWSPGSAPKDSASGTLPAGTTTAMTPLMFPSRPKIGPLFLTAHGNMGETYLRTDEKYHTNGNGAVALSQTIPLSRDWSLTPSLSPQLSWQDKFNPEPRTPIGSTAPVANVGLFRGFQGRMGTADNLRWRPLSAVTLDNTYEWNARLEPNGIGLDRGPADGGIETNHLRWVGNFRPSRRILSRSFSGYDLRKIANETPYDYQQRRVDPWVTDLTYDPNFNVEYYFRYQLGYYPTRGTLWEADYRYKGPYKTRLETGVLYNKGAPGNLTWNNHVGIFVSPGWRVDATLHSLIPNSSVNNAIRYASMIDDEFIVTRDMHCWQAQFVYRNIPPLTRQYSLTFNLKLGVTAKEQITNNDLESQYYPWRAQTYAP